MSIKISLITNNKVLRYIFCGGISAGLEFLIFAFLHQFVEIYIAAFISFLFGLITSYVLNKFIVFKKSGNNGVELTQFVLLGLINSQISSLLTTGLALIMPAIVAKVISIILIAIWNFIIMNTIIFKKR